MCVCVCVDMYIFWCARMYVCMNVCMCIFVLVFVYMYVYISLYVFCMRRYPCESVDMYTYVY